MTFEIAIDDRDLETLNVVRIKAAIEDMVTFTHSLVVDNESSFKTVTSCYRQARDWKKTIEEKRKEATEPFRRQQSLINDKAKELTDPLTKIENIAKLKAGEYEKHLEELKRQEEARIREAAAMLDIPEAHIYVEPLAPTIRGEGAMAYTVIEKKFRITDITQVPAKYLQLNEATIKQDLKLGISNIPGLEIYEEKITKLRTR
jgi:hypothetical protein